MVQNYLEGKKGGKILLLVGVLASVLILGCVGQSNLTMITPEGIEAPILEKKTVNVELLPLDADASNVVVNISGPPEFLFGGNESKSFEKLIRGQRFNVSFDYVVNQAGDYKLVLEAKASNARTMNRTINISTHVPAPKNYIGEFALFNQTVGPEPGKYLSEVVGKETIEGIEYYVVKSTWEGEPNGTYSLTYITDNWAARKKEYYEGGDLVKEKTKELLPPSLDYMFPFKVGSKWSWNGTFTGLGKAEMSAEVIGKETVTVPKGTYTSYHIIRRLTFPIGTSTSESWYVPEVRGDVKSRIKVSILGRTVEEENELIEYGLPPATPPKIQQDIKIPKGYKLFKSEKFNFQIAYPQSWSYSYRESTVEAYYTFTVDVFKVDVLVEPGGMLNLHAYGDTIMQNLRDTYPSMRFLSAKETVVNGRQAFELIWEDPSDNTKGKILLFVAGGLGYRVFCEGKASIYESYVSIYDSMRDSFFIKGSPRFTLE